MELIFNLVKLKTIQINNSSVLVDDEDYEWLSELNGWIITNRGYVQLHKNGYHCPIMVRLIMQAELGRALEPHEKVAYKNHNRLDCQKANLLLTTFHHTHTAPYKLPSTRGITSGYRGVYRNQTGFIAMVCQKYVLYSRDPLICAMAYDLAAYSIWGDRALLNFPDALHN